CQQYNNFPDTF
nr:immunoglobulin light chain junction region [Macaca mulatta]MOV65066.1 immunoglobulin light chain junction region [Macaca mulatta]